MVQNNIENFNPATLTLMLLHDSHPSSSSTLNPDHHSHRRH
jgi:hypothetical protein